MKAALRAFVALSIGFWAGLTTAAAIMRRVLRSRGDAGSDEVALVAIFDGTDLESRSQAFRGGSMLAWFGGITVDLREATLAAEGAHLDVHALNGGIVLRVPEGWRVQSSVRAVFGGVESHAPDPAVAEAPTLTLAGFAVFGGIVVLAERSDDA